MKTRKTIISRELRRAGVPAGIHGFCFLIEAVSLRYDKPLAKLFDDIYADVAKHYNTTISKVERAIRTAIMQSELCGQTANNFISEIACRVRDELEDY